MVDEASGDVCQEYDEIDSVNVKVKRIISADEMFNEVIVWGLVNYKKSKCKNIVGRW